MCVQTYKTYDEAAENLGCRGLSARKAYMPLDENADIFGNVWLVVDDLEQIEVLT